MHLLSFNDVFAASMIRAVCHMLTDSLWAGLLLFLVTGIIMLSTKKLTAAIRYNLLTGTFICFIIAMAAIFFIQITEAVSLGGQTAAPVLPNTATTTIVQSAHFMAGKGDLIFSVKDFLNRHADMIVLCWFLVIVFRTVSLVGGLRKIHQLKNTRLSSPGEEWNEKLILLSKQLGIRQGIRFFQSGIATIPMVAGHFKPVILFPLGLLTSLSPAEAEAILLHELAHIRRKDFLVNMLQHFAEMIFFFNPAVLWLSALIKIERENCCDDIAVVNTGNKRNYINALVSFQEYHLGTMPYAPALAGTKKHLLQRVKRMLNNNSSSLSKWEKAALSVCLAATATMTVFFAGAGMVSKSKAVASYSALADTSIADRHYDPAAFKEGDVTILTEKIKRITHVLRISKRSGVLYEIYDDIKSFKINGTGIPQEEWSKYKALMKSIMKETVSAKTIPQNKNEATEAASAKAMSDTDSKTAEKDSKTAEADSKTSELDSKTSAAASKASAADSEEDGGSMNTDFTIKASLQADMDARKADLKKKEAALQEKKEKSAKREIEWKKTKDGKPLIDTKLSYSENSYRNYTAAYSNPAAPYSSANYKPTEKNSYTLTGIQSSGSSPAGDIDMEKLTQNFIADLYAANAISNTSGLSYNMNSTSLIVNGVVQPDALHEKLKKKYIRYADWKLLYNWKQAR